MRELIKSMTSFSWAMSLFGMKQLGNLLTPRDSSQPKDKTGAAFDTVRRATEEQFDDVVNNAFKAGDRLQRAIVDMMFGVRPPVQTNSCNASANLSSRRQDKAPLVSSGTPSSQTTAAFPSPARRVNSGRLNTTTFIVLGEGLAAGMGNFTLSEETQRPTFPAQMAWQMQAEFPQPLIQAPGIGNAVGFAELPVRVPAPMQTTVLDWLPPTPVSNLSVPGFKLSDALNLRPAQPLICRNDAKQTAINLILGILPIMRGEEKLLPTQLEYALQRHPTFTVIELGYYEVLEAAVKGDPVLLPDVNSFHSNYAKLFKALKDSGSELLVLTIPDPTDTAHFSTVEEAAKVLKVEPTFVLGTYNLKSDDLITVNGLSEIGFQLFGAAIKPLPEGLVVSAETANQVSRCVRELNSGIIALAEGGNALLYDLHDFFHRVKREGVAVGPSRLTGEFLGGFYSLNGYYPGGTGQALIANELLHLLNRTYGADFPEVDALTVAISDPVTRFQQATGPNWTPGQLAQQLSRAASQSYESRPSGSPTEKVKTGRRRAAGWKRLADPQEKGPIGGLQLPPDLQQVLPVNKETSFFGDALRAVNCQSDKESQYGSCEGLLFGGLAMVDSHLSGYIRLKFAQPVNQITHFEVTHGDGLVGDDGVLAAPQFYKLPVRQNQVQDVVGMVSSGDLNLETGEVTNLNYYVRFSNSALLALARVNPKLPDQPINFPGQYGSAWAQFEQRPDGKLDFTFSGSTFLPLGGDIQGEPVLFPLSFVSPTLQFASIPAGGLALHPHLCLSTKKSEVGADIDDEPPDIPFNSVQEFTLFTHNSSFGDAFTLNASELGGSGKGRSHVLGRLQIQFGDRCGDSVPIAVWSLDAGGRMGELPASPITEAFPGRLGPGPKGFDEFLRFPLRTYSLNDIAIIDDPFDISVGAVSLKTGRLLNEMLHRGFINQDLIFALLRVEPRTPRDSFFFRGPALIERNADGKWVFRFQGFVHIPYPGGFLFPNPNFTTGFPVGPNSSLDPFLWIHAIQDDEASQFVKKGNANNVLSSRGERFSYRYLIPSDCRRQKASFEYENHTQKGSFRMHSLAWVGFSNSGTSQAEPGEYDTVTFTGFGIWSKDGVNSLQQTSVQISTSPGRPYVGIQIGSGDVSNVNTKPEVEQDALP
jgi:hypothetical protein